MAASATVKSRTYSETLLALVGCSSQLKTPGVDPGVTSIDDSPLRRIQNRWIAKRTAKDDPRCLLSPQQKITLAGTGISEFSAQL